MPQNPVQQISFLIKHSFHWTSFTQLSEKKIIILATFTITNIRLSLYKLNCHVLNQYSHEVRPPG